MKLNNLNIFIDQKLVRTVTFHDGLNLVTNIPNSGRTGNSVGKSTLSRVFDYLLLSDIKTIYIDEEYQHPNKEIEELFKSKNVVVDLNYIDYEGKLRNISRSLTIDQECLYKIDGQNATKDEYEIFLLKTMFYVHTTRPSLRLLAPKFIRNNSHRMLSTTRMLEKFQSKNDYSELYLYLFGFNNTQLLTKKREANNLLTIRKRNSTSINSIIREQKPTLEIPRIKENLVALERSILSIDSVPQETEHLDTLSELQSKEEIEISHLLSTERKLENINRTVQLFLKDRDNYLVDELKSIYDFAGVSIESGIKTLNEALRFHNNLIEKKRHYLEADIPKLNKEINILHESINQIRNKKQSVFEKIHTNENLEKLTEKLKSIGVARTDLGKLEGLIEQQELASTNLKNAEDALQKIIDEISKSKALLTEFEEIFNKYLRQATKTTHDEEYNISIEFNETTGTCEIEMHNSATNPEGGKKKAEVISFDISYINTVIEMKINRPSFVFHDSIEDIDTKQILSLFDIANRSSGQQILSMLSDKFDKATYDKLKQNIILELDEDHKFFTV